MYVVFDLQMKEEDIKSKKTNRYTCMLAKWVILQKDMTWQAQVCTRSRQSSHTKAGILLFDWGQWNMIVLAKQDGTCELLLPVVAI